MTDVKSSPLTMVSGRLRQHAAAPRFKESWKNRLRRWVLAAGYAAKPKRWAVLPVLTFWTVRRSFLSKGRRDTLPAPLRYHSWRGLVGISNDLSVDSLLANYARGLFPFCHMGPMKWWCPNVRAVIDPADTHVSKNVRRLLKAHNFDLSFDKDFASVIERCARPREGKVPLTWITPQIMDAFYEAHIAGHAHSIEVWDKQGTLIGGIYGLAVGRAFFGESQFFTVPHMSKVALIALHRHLAAWGFHLRDAKWMTPHLASFGFHPVPRDEFLALLADAARQPGLVGRWSADPTIDLVGGNSAPAAGSHKRG